MIKPDGQIPSLKPYLKKEPFAKWLSLTKETTEFLTLIELFNSIPIEWVIYIERNIEKVKKRGIIIRDPLSYRLSCLWNGIVLSEESKFITDTLETALRQIFCDKLITIGRNREYLVNTIPLLERGFKEVLIEKNNEVNSRDISKLSFYQIHETIGRNWNYIVSLYGSEGFKEYFLSKKRLYSSVFNKNMKYCRQQRNNIVHFRKLITPCELNSLYSIVNGWLTPLSVDLKQRVLKFRKKRPKFLEPLAKVSHGSYPPV